jgi:hypothetical protein
MKKLMTISFVLALLMYASRCGSIRDAAAGQRQIQHDNKSEQYHGDD